MKKLSKVFGGIRQDIADGNIIHGRLGECDDEKGCLIGLAHKHITLDKSAQARRNSGLRDYPSGYAGKTKKAQQYERAIRILGRAITKVMGIRGRNGTLRDVERKVYDFNDRNVRMDEGKKLIDTVVAEAEKIALAEEKKGN